MRRLVLAVSLAALSAGCATATGVGVKPEDRPAPVSMVTRADNLHRQGQPMAARDLYVQIVAEPDRDAEHARALYNLARLYADPSGGLRDYRAASLAFKRLLMEYPKGEWEADAQAWNTVLGELAVRDDELGKHEAEAARLKNETMKLAAEVARLKNEKMKLAADLERLKRIDLNLERRR